MKDKMFFLNIPDDMIPIFIYFLNKLPYFFEMFNSDTELKGLITIQHELLYREFKYC